MDTSEKNFEASIEASLLRDPLSSGPGRVGVGGCFYKRVPGGRLPPS